MKIWTPGITVVQDVADQLDWLLDFSPELGEEDTIDFLISTTASGGMSVVSTILTASTVTVFMEGGTIGIEGKVDVYIQTSNATPRKISRSILFNIKDL